VGGEMAQGTGTWLSAVFFKLKSALDLTRPEVTPNGVPNTFVKWAGSTNRLDGVGTAGEVGGLAGLAAKRHCAQVRIDGRPSRNGLALKAGHSDHLGSGSQ